MDTVLWILCYGCSTMGTVVWILDYGYCAMGYGTLNTHSSFPFFIFSLQIIILPIFPILIYFPIANRTIIYRQVLMLLSLCNTSITTFIGLPVECSRGRKLPVNRL